MTKSEAQIQDEIMIALSSAGHRVWRSNAGNIRNEFGRWIKLLPKGFPDLVGYRHPDGQFLVIEVKTPRGRMSDAQKDFAQFALGQPIIYGVATCPQQAVDRVKRGKMTDSERIEFSDRWGVPLPF